MKSHKFFNLLFMATTISLILSLFFTATAIADDSTPPTATEEPVIPPTVEPVATLDPIVQEIPTTLPEVLDQLPADITVIIMVDDQIEPMATLEAANTFVVGDPIWCPDGDPPIPGVGNCTTTYLDLFSLIDDIDNGVIPQPAEDGTIWIMGGNDASSSDISIDGTSLNFSTWSNYSLTLQGGWDGTSTIGSNISGSSVFSVPVSIVNWGGPVTINQIVIDGTNSTGLEIETSGDIALDEVSSINNSGNGAELTSLGSVTLTGVNIFDDNDDVGLYISAADDIDAENLSADGNGSGGIAGNGAELYSTSGSVTLSGINTFEDNFDAGLYVEATGDVDVENVTASGNGGSGAELASSAGGVNLIGTLVFEDNTLTGLFVDAFADIDAENITASDNGAGGADLNSSGGSVFLSGSNIFVDNDVTGLVVDALGDIDVISVTASGNGSGGVSGGGAELNSSTGNVSVTGVNFFDDNFESGLFVDVVGDIDAENITASNNGSNGADLSSSAGAVFLSGTNVFNDNNTSGLVVDSFGDIDVSNVTASGNGAGSGAELDSSTGNVSLTGTNVFEDNNDNGLSVDAGGDIDAENITAGGNGAIFGTGAEFNSSGSVSLTGVNTFTGNKDAGLFIDAVGDVDVENVTAVDNSIGAELNLSGALSIVGDNVFNNNDGVGLYVDAVGDINAENLTVNDNGVDNALGNGAELYTLGSFSLVGTNVFNGNNNTGLYVDAFGEIDVENVTANNNGVGGVFGNGAEFYSLSSFTLSGVNTFNDNYSDGLFVHAVLGVAIDETYAGFNGGNGLYIETDGSASVTCGVLNDNIGYEIEADLLGLLTLNGVDFGGSIDSNLGVDEDQLLLVSNGCFTYPPIDNGEDDDNDDDSGSDGGNVGDDFDALSLPVLPVNNLIGKDGQTVALDCTKFQGTLVTLVNGDGAYIPCFIVDSARLVKLPVDALPGDLPPGNTMVSSFNLSITKDGQVVQPIDMPGSIWYANTQDPAAQIVYWDGSDWVDAEDRIYPFMRVFFAIPDALKNLDLAILYWDGVKWVELLDNQNIGDGRIVQKGGHVSAEGFFEGSVNFIGTFVLVQK